MTAHQPDPSSETPGSTPRKEQPGEGSPMAGLAAEYAAKAGLHRTHDGRVVVLRSAGGVLGIAIDRLAFAPFRRRGLSGQGLHMPTMISSLAVALLLEGANAL